MFKNHSAQSDLPKKTVLAQCLMEAFEKRIPPVIPALLEEIKQAEVMLAYNRPLTRTGKSLLDTGRTPSLPALQRVPLTSVTTLRPLLTGISDFSSLEYRIISRV